MRFSCMCSLARIFRPEFAKSPGADFLFESQSFFGRCVLREPFGSLDTKRFKTYE